MQNGVVVLVVLLACAAASSGAFRAPATAALRGPPRTRPVWAAAEGSLLELTEANVDKVLELVRPQLAADGGGVSLAKVEEHEVTVRFEGACRACPHRVGTVKCVIEDTLARFIKAPQGKHITVKLVEDD